MAGLLGPIALSAGGCSSEDELDDATISLKREYGETLFPIMLDGQVIRAEGRAWRLRHEAISEVEVHEIKEPAAKIPSAKGLSEGWYTATVSMTVELDNQPLRAKVRVTYKMQNNKSKSGLSGWSFPVRKLTVLSVKRLDDSPP